MGDSHNKNKVVVILLMAAVVAVGATNQKSGAMSSILTKMAVQALCSPTNFKDICEESLADAKNTDPKELFKLAFDVTAKQVGDVLKKSELLKEAESDPSTKEAYKVCEAVLENAVDDLRTSIDKLGEFRSRKFHEYVEDLRVWLSAVIVWQETCIDAFEGITGDAGEKMRRLQTTARQMSSNALSMVSDASSILGSLHFESSLGLMSVEPTATSTDRMSLKPTIVVAKDGSGNFKTIGEAIASFPLKTNDSIVVYVKEGVYEEYIEFPRDVNNVMLVGDGPLKTRITGNKCFAKGVNTWNTSTVGVNGEDFFAMNIGFENTAGAAGHQAVALRVSGDKAVFYNVAIDGYQDSLCAHMKRQYYRDCTISGTIDFVFGDAKALFQNCNFIVRKPGPNQGCMVTAEGRTEDGGSGGFVIQNSNITAEPEFLTAKPAVKAYLGRPWKAFSRTIVMQSNIDGFIDPAGWSPWMGTFALDTLYYGEYENRGAGSSTANRVKWKGIKTITPEIAKTFTGGVFFAGDEWITNTGVPYVRTMMEV